MAVRGEPVGHIKPVAPVPSILTTARDRTADDFGVHVPPGPAGPEGSGTPVRDSWRSGLAWSSRCQESFASWVCPEPGFTREPDADAGGAVMSAPFHLYTPLSCEWARDEDEVESYAADLNEAHLAWGMAKAVWMGEGIDSTELTQPTLRRSAIDVSGAAAVTLDEGFELLLAYYELGTGGSGGAIIHLPSVLATSALGGGNGGAILMRPEGNVYRGPLGALVSPGPGYPLGGSSDGEGGYGPLIDDDPTEVYAGNEDDEAWVYISGPLEYALGAAEVERPDADSHLRRNTVEAWARRAAVYRFDPCSVWAVLVESPVAIPEVS
jgi:hypothetical protein